MAQDTAKRRTGSNLWAFLNSNFGVWLLSSVILTGIVTGYTAIDNRSKEKERTQLLIENLDMEIAVRIYKAETKLEQGRLRHRMPAALAATFRILNGESNTHVSFKAIPLYMLIRELQRALPASQRTELDKPFRIAIALAELEPKLTPLADLAFNPVEAGSRPLQDEPSEAAYYRTAAFESALKTFKKQWGDFVTIQRWRLNALGQEDS